MRPALVAAACAVAWCGCLDAPPGPPAADDAAPGGSQDAAPGCVPPVIAASSATSCALLADGTARCFGHDDFGELGNDEDRLDSSDPVPVAELDQVTQLVGGSYAFCALRSDQTARCWGQNGTGQLGDQTDVERGTPVDVLDVTDIVDIEIGAGHACAVVEGRALRCWGRNNNGQLGNGAPAETSFAPVLASVGLVLDVDASYGATCAILDDDAGVACWGQVTGGFNSAEPITYDWSGVRGLSMFANSVYAVLADGTVMAWGNNQAGQLGDDTLDSREQPMPVLELPPVMAVAAGAEHACALEENGTVWCWGSNLYAQLGAIGEPDSRLPVVVEGIPTAVALVAGMEHTCATAEDGTIHCWGNNCCGQLGPRELDPTTAPGPIGVSELCVTP